MHYLSDCSKSSNERLDKRFVFEVMTKNSTVLTFQAPSSEDFKSWFAIMEGKNIPVK